MKDFLTVLCSLVLILIPSELLLSCSKDDMMPGQEVPVVENPEPNENPDSIVSEIDNLEFEFEGLRYTILDEDSKTCKTKCGSYIADWNRMQGVYEYRFRSGCEAEGAVSIPEYVSDGHTEYRVVAVGDFSFAECDGIEIVELPESIEVIGQGAFFGCQRLKNINLPNELKIIHDVAFIGCVELPEVLLPEGLVEIGSRAAVEEDFTLRGAFAFCQSLASISFPNSLTYVGDRAFESCESLSHVDIPESFTDDIFGIYVFDSCAFETFDVPSAFTRIPRAFFYCCKKLSSIELPKSVIYIEKDAFNGCESLSEINIHDNVNGFGEGAFAWCKSLKEIRIPEGMEEIPYLAFYRTSIESLEIPHSVKIIGKEAFECCNNLRHVAFPAGLEDIRDGAFFQCVGLDSIYFPESLKSIGHWAYYGCSNLKVISLPGGLQRLEPEAFWECKSLLEVRYRTDDPCEVWNSEWSYGGGAQFKEKPFDKTTFTKGVLKVGKEGKDKASEINPWKCFVNIEEFDM